MSQNQVRADVWSSYYWKIHLRILRLLEGGIYQWIDQIFKFSFRWDSHLVEWRDTQYLIWVSIRDIWIWFFVDWEYRRYLVICRRGGYQKYTKCWIESWVDLFYRYMIIIYDVWVSLIVSFSWFRIFVVMTIWIGVGEVVIGCSFFCCSN